MFGRASTRVPVAFGRAPLLVRLAIFIGIVRRLFDGLEGNAVEVDTMNALAIEHLGLCGEARFFGLIWPAGQPIPFARSGLAPINLRPIITQTIGSVFISALL